MKYFTRVFLKGLAATLPVGLTVFFIYWLGKSLESILKPIIISVMPESYYWPGLALISGILIIFCIGILVEAYIVRKLFYLGETLLERIPLIKSIYGGLRDFMEYFTQLQDSSNMQRVVIVNFGDARMIGFVTSEKSKSDQKNNIVDNLVTVYLPMSYQIGGFTVHVPEEMVEPYDISTEDAMRKILTAGLSKNKKK